MREVAAAAGRIPLSDRSRALLPDLRSRIQALLDRARSDRVTASELGSLSVESETGRLRVQLEPGIGTRGLVSRGEIQSLLNSIDAYLLSQLRDRSRNRVETHRGITFLVSTGEGGKSPILDADETRSRIDDLDGGIPAYVPAEVSKHVFECEIRATYPFRTAPMSCPRHR